MTRVYGDFAVLCILLFVVVFLSCTIPHHWVIVNDSDTEVAVRYSTGAFSGEGTRAFLMPAPLVNSAGRFRDVEDYRILAVDRFRVRSEGVLEVSIQADSALIVGVWPPTGTVNHDIASAYLEVRVQGERSILEGRGVFDGFKRAGRGLSILKIE